jgi:predicted dehydrogenase
MSSGFQVGLIGYGYAGRTFHAPLIRATPGLDLVAVASRDAEKVHGDLPDVTVMSPDALFTAPDVDVVVIATPNHTHAPLSVSALRAGKHVVVDKPFAVTLDEARAIVKVAEDERRMMTVFQNRRWDSDFLGVRSAIASRAVGEVAHFESHIDRYRPEVRARWREEPGPGAGLWYDLGPHLVDQALLIFGLPSKVLGVLRMQRAGARTDDWAHAILDYERVRVVLHASLLSAARLPRFIVHGPAGSWIKYGVDVQEQQLMAGLRPGEERWGEDGDLALLFDSSGAARPMTAPPGDYRRFYVQFRDALTGAAPNPVSPAQAIAVMAIIETATESSAAGRTLPLPLTDAERRDFEASLDAG